MNDQPIHAGPPEAAISAWLATQQDAMLALLQRMVDIDSGSYDKPGIDAVGEVVREFLHVHGVAVETIPRTRHGDCLRAAVAADTPGGLTSGGNAPGHVMLLGHRDTVFPKGEVARRPFTHDGDTAHGPGVADMKAGLVMNCFVLAAFARFGGAPSPLIGLFTGDEEIGSPEGREIIEAQARGARAVFNSEPGRPTADFGGNVVTGRKGGVFMKLAITGRAAHSGGNWAEGISAIEELARKVQAIHALTDLDRGVTLNVGLIAGGQSVNTVAPSATAEIDLRYVQPGDREDLLARIGAIVERSYVPGTTATLEIAGDFLPMSESDGSRRLFDAYAAAAGHAGFHPKGEFVGGCADSGFTANVGAPTICGVGPVGGRAHTPEEFLRTDTLVPRAQAVARAILGLEAAGL